MTLQKQKPTPTMQTERLAQKKTGTDRPQATKMTSTAGS